MGVLAFILTLLFLVLVHEWGHFFVARRLGVKVEEFGFGFPPRIAKKHWKGTDYTFNWLPFGGFVRLKGEEDVDSSPDSFSTQAAWRRALIVVAGVVMNLILAAVLLSFVAGMGVRQDITDKDVSGLKVNNISTMISNVVSGSPADGYIKTGDEILLVDNNNFSTISDIQNYIQSSGQEINIQLLRGEEVVDVQISPQEFFVNELNESYYGLGIQLQSVGTVKYSWYEAPLKGLEMTGQILKLIVVTLGQAIVNAFNQQPTPGLEVTGPIGIAILTSDVVKLGLSTFLQFIAVLSINLAFLNLLPIPALDGGRLAFIIFEMIARRPLSEKIEMSLHRIGFSLLLLLILVVTIMDVGRFAPDWISSVSNNFLK